MKEIKFIGRGGQGGKSAAAILADAALEKGDFIQSFPEYGAERQGAPVYAYTRIDQKEIRIHSGITNPQIVAVLDSTLLTALPVTEGMPDDGILIVNTVEDPKQVRSRINFHSGRVFTVDATGISIDAFGKNIPNTPMLGAVEKATGLVTLDVLKKKISDKFIRKIGQEGVDKNLNAIQRAYDEVKEG
ncbi:2-oxoacid:acceptor oxidoreductase family protein [Candidatus Woesearchaeota archaeon]|nr:2-oxoacid:acceptor oxidoreductase family protein [Candidatus Woesearchaeota archaeon]